ncbi:MAG TPA: YfhO family protein [Bacteroidota bacterium]|nr:YfhO family protein [Bacteroidota bacterium]
MSKTHKERTGGRPTPGESPLIPERFQHLAAIAILFISLVVFFNQLIFGGKMFTEVDVLASRSFDTFLADAKLAGIFPLWNPYIFCGMPSYGSLTVGGDRFFDISAQILTNASTLFSYIILNPAEGWVLFFYMVFAGGVYLFTYDKVRSKFAAFVAAFSATFSMYIIIWVMSGHNTKIAVMAFFPYILFVVERLREKFSWTLALLLVLLLHFSYMPSHIQMIFYVYLTLGVYFLFFLIKSFLKKKDADTGSAPAAWKGLVRAGLVFAFASVIAFAMDADKYLSVLEYNPYSMRGSNPIVQSKDAGDAKTVEGGLSYKYATEWSFGPSEMLTWVVPSWYGFGLLPYKGVLTNNQETSMNFYWGPQPFTHAPQYMGLTVLVLALIGFWRNRKDGFVQFMGVMIVFSLLIAFGRELPVVYDLMYRFFPMFNKFRVPSMILVLIQIFVPILAAYGIATFMRERGSLQGAELQKAKRSLLIGLGVSVAVLAVIALSFESFVSKQAIQNAYGSLTNSGLPRDQIYTPFFDQVRPEAQHQIAAELSSLAVTDIWVAIGLLVATLGLMYYFIQNKIKFNTFAMALVIIIGFDLWRVDVRPMDPHDKSVTKQVFATPEYVKYLQRDTTLYRVLEFQNGRPPYNNMLAYWRIQSAYGYQGAKMRSYQDMDDVAGLGNPLLWGLMNVKYIISNTEDSSSALGLVYNGRDMKVYGNRYMLPRAFFVNKYEVADGITILNKIKDMTFDPREVMYFMEDPKVTVEPVHPAATVDITHYGIQDLTMQTKTAGNNLLFLSETYYPVGWKAFLDGKEIPIYRANYLFRALVVPAGQHQIEMRFEPKGFYIGKNLSLAANILVLGGLSFFGFEYWRKKRPPQQAAQQTNVS